MSGVGGYGYSILGYPYLQMPAAMLQAQAASGQTATGIVAFLGLENLAQAMYH